MKSSSALAPPVVPRGLGAKNMQVQNNPHCNPYTFQIQMPIQKLPAFKQNGILLIF